jgi:hypothetical protein
MSDIPKDLQSSAELTSAVVIQKLRAVCCPPGKKGTWLRLLNDRQLAEVYHRLKLGQPSYRIARIAQEEWGIRKKAEVKSLARAVRKFKEEALGLIHVEKTAPSEDRKELGRKLEGKALTLTKKVDGLGRLGWLIERQTERVLLLMDREKNALPFKFTGDEIETLSDMIEKYVKLQVTLGIVDTPPPEINLNVKHRFDGLLQHTVQGGTAVIEAADRWLQKCEESALTLRRSEDGRYELVKGEFSDACEPKVVKS